MSQQFLKGLWAASLAAACVVASIPARAAGLLCTVPFEFVANGKTLPPGDYLVSQLATGALSLRGTRGGAFVPAKPVVSRDGAKWTLVFHRYGDQYFLRQARMAGDGAQIAEPPAERELVEARQAAGVFTPVARIEVPRN